MELKNIITLHDEEREGKRKGGQVAGTTHSP
jgi:hypothetical protein